MVNLTMTEFVNHDAIVGACGNTPYVADVEDVFNTNVRANNYWPQQFGKILQNTGVLK